MSLLYQDVCTRSDGTLAYVTADDKVVVARGLWSVPVRRQWLDLRAGMCGGHLVAIGKESDSSPDAHDGGTVWITIDGAPVWEAGLTFGANSVAVGPDGLYIVRSGTRIDVVSLAGVLLRVITASVGSQGIRDVTLAGELRLGDLWLTRVRDGLTLYQPMERGAVMVGQADPAQIAGDGPEGLFTARVGFAYEPHVTQLGDGRYVACARPWANPVFVPPYPPLVTSPTVPPIEPPTPIPPQPGVPMKLPAHVFATLQSVRAKYPTPLGNQGAAVLNETAWIHRAEGYGLHSKPAGFNCPQPKSGASCSCDFLRLSTLGFDVLADAEGAGTPVQADSQSADAALWLPPVDPGAITVPPIPPTQPPTQPPQQGNALPSDWVSATHWQNVEIQQIAAWYREKHGVDMGLSDWAFQAYRRLGPELWTMAQIKAGI